MWEMLKLRSWNLVKGKYSDGRFCLMTTSNIATFDCSKEKHFAAMEKYFAPMFVCLIYVPSCNVPRTMCKTVFSDLNKDLHRQVLQKRALNDFSNSLITKQTKSWLGTVFEYLIVIRADFFMMMFHCFLLSFSLILDDISNTQDSVWPHF